MSPKKILIYICLSSSLFYALETSLVDKKLPNIPPMALTFWSGLGITIISGVLLLLNQKGAGGFYMPTSTEWALIGLVTIFFFGADYTHFYALHLRAGAVLLSTTYLLIPVIASVIEFQQPSLQLVLSWMFGFASLLLLFSK